MSDHDRSRPEFPCLKLQKWKLYKVSGSQGPSCNTTNHTGTLIKPSRVQIAAYQLTRTAICPPDSPYFWESLRLQIIRTRTSEDATTQRWQRLSATESFTCCAGFFADLPPSLAAALAGVFHVCVQFVTLMEPLCLNHVNLLNLSLAVTEKDTQGGSKTSMHSSSVTP